MRLRFTEQRCRADHSKNGKEKAGDLEPKHVAHAQQRRRNGPKGASPAAADDGPRAPAADQRGFLGCGNLAHKGIVAVGFWRSGRFLGAAFRI